MFQSIRRSTAVLMAVMGIAAVGALPATALAGATASKRPPGCKKPSYAAKHKRECKGGGRY
jgi:hypothetical protein